MYKVPVRAGEVVLKDLAQSKVLDREGREIVLEPTRCMWWPKSKLQDFLKNNPELRAAFQRIIGADLSSRLQAAWTKG